MENVVIPTTIFINIIIMIIFIIIIIIINITIVIITNPIFLCNSFNKAIRDFVAAAACSFPIILRITL